MDEPIEDCDDEGGFPCLEIDPEYEFDASCYFDFCRGESFSEAQEAELWFESAGSYPPSPYIIKLHLGEDIIVENVNSIPKTKDVIHGNSVANSDDSMSSDLSVPEETYGATCNDHMAEDFPKAKTKSVRVPFSRCSTLMKPTASQLAKQNQPRFRKSLVQKTESSFENPSGIESHAAKRQKLEGGHLHKIPDLKQQISLRHKVPQKGCNSEKSRLQVTIPREPQLRTAVRAQRLRAKNHVEVQEQTLLPTTKFIARRINRKILEAPLMPLPKKSIPRLPEFQEFHLKTSERAIQHSSATSSSHHHSNTSEKALVNCSSKCSQDHENMSSQHQRARTIEYHKQEESKVIPHFKAHPVDKKILASKGEIGVFRTTKRGTTMPMEFNFVSGKQFQDPPIELFKMLTLTGGLKDNIVSQKKMSQAMPRNGLKENMEAPLQQQEPKMGKKTLEQLGGKQVQCGNHWGMAAIRCQGNMFRRGGIC